MMRKLNFEDIVIAPKYDINIYVQNLEGKKGNLGSFYTAIFRNEMNESGVHIGQITEPSIIRLSYTASEKRGDKIIFSSNKWGIF